MWYNLLMDRQHDLEMIEKELRRPGLSELQRKQLLRAKDNIVNENKKIKSMREALVKAHREGNIEEINDIREFTERHREYRSSF